MLFFCVETTVMFASISRKVDGEVLEKTNSSCLVELMLFSLF